MLYSMGKKLICLCFNNHMSKYELLLEHIDRQWNVLRTDYPQDSSSHLSLANSFIAPSVHRVEGFVFREQFYWDSYFTLLALIDTDIELAKGMVDNLFDLFNRLGYIPNSNNRYHLGRSQPPLLNKMVELIYAKTEDKNWLKKGLDVLEREYEQVWLGNIWPHKRAIFKGLSRYYHQEESHYGAEDESGWDYTDRFDDRALDYLPIDLNCFLYGYETSIAQFHLELSIKDKKIDWSHRAEKRRETINQLMWVNGFYRDFDYINHQASDNYSLAGYSSMFVELADEKQAKAMVEKLELFETEFGLSATPQDNPATVGKQWTSPNGWAPLHYLVIVGLDQYGHKEAARRLAGKWVKSVNQVFLSEGKIYEKYNMVDIYSAPTSAVYPDQYGFAWSNAVTYRLIKDFDL